MCDGEEGSRGGSNWVFIGFQLLLLFLAVCNRSYLPRYLVLPLPMFCMCVCCSKNLLVCCWNPHLQALRLQLSLIDLGVTKVLLSFVSDPGAVYCGVCVCAGERVLAHSSFMCPLPPDLQP